jgi:hypothetical protein
MNTMSHKLLVILVLFCGTTAMSFAQTSIPAENDGTAPSIPHRYGGWYCPDNLGGFPAVDIQDWADVPVVNGRMPTQEETQNGASLISVDMEKYPDAKPMDLTMPQLARFYNAQSGKNELVIVIQAVNISNDSIVGFRYLNGGNGSARFSEVTLLSEEAIESLPDARFVQFNVTIQAAAEAVWSVLTSEECSPSLKATFDPNNALEAGWDKSRANFYYPHAGTITRSFAGEIWGSLYIQIDAQKDPQGYTEKFFLSENKDTNETTLVIACGPYREDFKGQQSILKKWAEEVKALSEKI